MLERNGQPRTHLARLNPDGSLDAAFSPKIDENASSIKGIYCIAVQPDQKIYIGGRFHWVNDLPRQNFARLLPNGTADPRPPLPAGLLDFGMDTEVQSMALQADGKLLCTGSFYLAHNMMRKNCARFLPDQSLDPSWTAGPLITYSGTHSIALQADGKVLLTGPPEYVEATGTHRSRLYRFYNEPAVQTLDIPAPNRIVWMRGGSTPETSQVTFESSTNGGATWKNLGARARIAGGWEWTGHVLPSRVTVRARGLTAGGYQNATQGVVESVASFDHGPGASDLSLEFPAGTALPHNGTAAFGDVLFGARASRTFTVRNSGDGDLSGLQITFTGPDAALFSVTSPPSPAVVEPGESAAFTVEAAAAAPGPRTATLRLASNDPDETPWSATLTVNVTGPATEIALEHPAGVNFPDGATVDFGPVTTDSSSSRTLLIKNTGAGNLIGLTTSKDGPDASAFTVTFVPAAPVLPGGSTSLTVKFSPSSPGNKSAALHLLSNDLDESFFDIVLTGAALTPAPTGGPDVTFAGTGQWRASAGFDRSAGTGVLLQPDGKILVSGYFWNQLGTYDFALWRFLPDGRPDLSFNNTGLVRTNFSGGSKDLAHALALQSDGKILVAGESAGAFALARYLPDGRPDTLGFTSAGRVTTPFGDPTRARAESVALQSDGRIVLAGTATDPGDTFAFVRYLPNGTPDASFGDNGRLVASIGGGGGQCTAMAVQSNDRIVASGVSVTPEGLYRFALIRFTVAGHIDGSFGTGGAVLTDFGTYAAGHALALQSDGRLLVAGSARATENNPGFTNHDFALARYESSGSPDLSFNGNGRLTTHRGPYSNIAYTVAVQPDGKILIAGDTSGAGGNIFRLLPDGSPDSTFNSAATGVFGTSVTRAMALQPDGRILLAGSASNTGAESMTLQRFIGSSFPRPEILVRDPAGLMLPQNASGDFGAVLTNSGRSLTYTVHNAGTAPLTGIAPSLAGADAAQFTITSPPPATLPPGASAPFTIRFAPNSQSAKTALLRIASNDADASPLEIPLQGSGRALTDSDTWRMTWFGTYENSGPSADFSDPDADGWVNLAEYATGANPLTGSPSGLNVTVTDNIELTWQRRTAAMPEVDITLEYSDTPNTAWHPSLSQGSPLTDDGTLQTIKALFSPTAPETRFFRLRIFRR